MLGIFFVLFLLLLLELLLLFALAITELLGRILSVSSVQNEDGLMRLSHAPN